MPVYSSVETAVSSKVYWNGKLKCGVQVLNHVPVWVADHLDGQAHEQGEGGN
jgi:hypothetical protein